MRQFAAQPTSPSPAQLRLGPSLSPLKGGEGLQPPLDGEAGEKANGTRPHSEPAAVAGALCEWSSSRSWGSSVREGCSSSQCDLRAKLDALDRDVAAMKEKQVPADANYLPAGSSPMSR